MSEENHIKPARRGRRCPTFKTDSRNIKGLYVHIPFCDGKCFYCAFYSQSYETGLARRYLGALRTELKRYPRLNVATVYFGGGTPSMLSTSELHELCGVVQEHISSAALKEWTVECNPRSLTADKLALLAEAGVNRISLGAQSFDADVLKWLGRRHSVADIYEAAHMIQSAGFGNFGLDLMACVPGCKPDSWKKTLNAAVALEPGHISVYALTREEGSRLAKAVSEDKIKLLTDDEEIEALDLAAAVLAKANYRRYEISNYAQPGFECLHNLSCWRGEEYIGLGAAAASHVGLKRWTNLPDLGKYLEALAAGRQPPYSVDVINAKLRQIEKIVFGLRLTEGISETTANICRNTLLAFNAAGLVLNDHGRWRLTKRGMNLADYVGSELLAGAD